MGFQQRGSHKIIFVLLFLFLFAGAEGASGKVYIDIDSPAFRQFPIAVTDFARSEGPGVVPDELSPWFSDTLAQYLRMTGYFNPLNKKAFLEDKASSGKVPGSITFGDWMAIGAEYLVKGDYSVQGGVVSAGFRLFDVVKGELLAEKSYTARNNEERLAIVVDFAGEILFALTGERGVFHTKIAFVRKEGKGADIYSVNFDGSGVTRITNYRALALAPRWSPDGRRLAFTSYRDGKPDLYITDLAGHGTKKVSGFAGINMPGAWSPDGKKLLITLSKDGNAEIYVLDLENGLLSRLTNQFSIDVSPAWSPDGQKIVFVSDRSGSPQVYIMDASGANVKRLTYEGNYNTSPSWSPKGNRIAYEGSTNGNFQIFTIDPSGSDLQQLTFDPGAHESPSWSPDGRYLAFVLLKGNSGELYVMNANGTNQRLLYKDGATATAWSPRLP